MENALMLGNNYGVWGELGTSGSVKRKQLHHSYSQFLPNKPKGQFLRFSLGEPENSYFYCNQPIFK